MNMKSRLIFLQQLLGCIVVSVSQDFSKLNGKCSAATLEVSCITVKYKKKKIFGTNKQFQVKIIHRYRCA